MHEISVKTRNYNLQEEMMGVL